MKIKPSPIIEKSLFGLLFLLAVWSILAVIFIIFSRSAYPYSLERMEGASLLQVTRILNGQPFYSQPSIEYVPLIYPPVYFYLSALFMKIMGVGFLPLRLVSILSFAGCIAFVFVIIKSVSGDNYASSIGAGLFAATYPLSGAWFDIARIDTLFVFFCIAGIYYSIGERKSDLILSGIFWSLAVFTKQTGLIVLLSSFAFLLLRDFRNTVIRILITGAVSLSFYIVCSSLWGGWFNYFIFYLPTFHKTLTNLSDISTAVLQLMLPLVVAVLIGISPLMFDRSLRSRRSPVLYYGFMTCIMFGLSLLGRLNLGGYTNVYMPAHIMTAVMFGIGLHWWRGKFQTSQHLSPSLLTIVLFGVCASQFLNVYFDPRLVIPHPSLAQSWFNLESLIRSADGDVLAPEINYLTSFAGRNPFANQVAVEEIFGRYGNPEPVQRDVIRDELLWDLQNKRFRIILLKDSDGAWSQVDDYYQCSPFSSEENAAIMPPVIVQDYTICLP